MLTSDSHMHVHTYTLIEKGFLSHTRHEVQFCRVLSLDCSKWWGLKGSRWPSCGKQFVYTRMSQRRWLTWKLYTHPTCFRHACKNKQPHICNWRVKMSHVGPGDNLANRVPKRWALMMLSKAMLWPLSLSPHLEKIKTERRKRSEFETRARALVTVLRFQVPKLSLHSRLGENIWKACIFYGQNLFNPYLRGKINAVQNPRWTGLSGNTFSWKGSHLLCHFVFRVSL